MARRLRSTSHKIQLPSRSLQKVHTPYPCFSGYALDCSGRLSGDKYKAVHQKQQRPVIIIRAIINAPDVVLASAIPFDPDALLSVPQGIA